MADMKSSFENWVSKGGDPDYKQYLKCDIDGNYKLSTTAAAYAAWQAAIAAQEAEIKRLRSCLEDADIWIPEMREAIDKGGEWFWLDARMMNLEAWHKDIKEILKTKE